MSNSLTVEASVVMSTDEEHFQLSMQYASRHDGPPKVTPRGRAVTDIASVPTWQEKQQAKRWRGHRFSCGAPPPTVVRASIHGIDSVRTLACVQVEYGLTDATVAAECLVHAQTFISGRARPSPSAALLGEETFVPGVIGVMRAHTSSPAVQSAALALLARLAAFEPHTLVEAGAVGAIVAAMTAQPTQALAAFQVLGMLAYDVSCQEALVAEGGLREILGVISRAGRLELQQHCLAILLPLSASLPRALELLECGCVEDVLALMRRQPRVAELQIRAVGVIASLLARSNDTCHGTVGLAAAARLLAAPNGVDTLVAAMRAQYLRPDLNPPAAGVACAVFRASQVRCFIFAPLLAVRSVRHCTAWASPRSVPQPRAGPPTAAACSQRMVRERTCLPAYAPTAPSGARPRQREESSWRAETTSGPPPPRCLTGWPRRCASPPPVHLAAVSGAHCFSSECPAHPVGLARAPLLLWPLRQWS